MYFLQVYTCTRVIAAVRALTIKTPAAHGPLCRLSTVCTAAGATTAFFGPWWGAAAAVSLSLCPVAALWFLAMASGFLCVSDEA